MSYLLSHRASAALVSSDFTKVAGVPSMRFSAESLAAILANGDPVSSHVDAHSGIIATNSILARRPTFVAADVDFNGLPSVQYSSTGTICLYTSDSVAGAPTNPGFDFSNGITIISVVAPDTQVNGHICGAPENGTGRIPDFSVGSFQRYFTGLNMYLVTNRDVGIDLLSDGQSRTLGAAHIEVARTQDPDPTDRFAFWLNGAKTSGAGTGTGPAHPQTQNPIWLGWGYSNTYNGRIAEQIVYAGSLSDAEIVAIAAGLNLKYAVH